MKDRMDYEAQFVRDPGTCGGEAVFRGTRVLLRVVLADLAAWVSTIWIQERGKAHVRLVTVRPRWP